MGLNLYWNGEITFSMGTGNKNVDEMTRLSLKERHYGINNSIYRDLVSAVLKMSYKAKFKIVFFTATFAYNPSEEEAQKIFINFLKNLRLNEKFNNYVWTKERQKNGHIHYHFLTDCGYMDITKLQATFNKCVKNVNRNAQISINSLRLPNSAKFGNIVTDPIQTAKYIGKYFSKSRGQEWKFRSFAISKRLYPLRIEIKEHEALKLCTKYKYKTYSDCQLYSKTYLINENMMSIRRDFTCFDDRIT